MNDQLSPHASIDAEDGKINIAVLREIQDESRLKAPHRGSGEYVGRIMFLPLH